MTPLNYAGIAVMIGGGYFVIMNLRSLYAMGCHRPAGMLLGSIGVIYLGLKLVNKADAEEEPAEE
jgi:hypothetical protein